MKKSFKKLSLVLVVVMLFAVALSGCGSSAAPSTEKMTEATAAVESTATTESAAATKEVVAKTITYYGFSDWVTGDALKANYADMVTKFQTANPGVTVELKSDPWDTWVQKTPVLLASGNSPDVFLVNNPDIPTFSNGGYTADLTDLGQNYLKQFFPGVLSMYVQKGKTVGLPFTTDCRVLWYNKDIFKAAGIANPPATWEELKTDALLIAKTKVNGQKVYGYGMDLALKAFPAESLFCASNGSIVNKDTLVGQTNTAEFTKYLQLLVDMKPSYEPDFNTLNHQNVSTLFAQKKVGMIIAGMWPWSVNKGLKDQDFYGMAMVPKMDASSPDGSFGGGFCVSVSSNSKNLAEAKKLAQFMVSPEINATLMSDLPATQAGLDASSAAKDAKAALFLKQIASARQAQGAKTVYYTEIDTAVWDTVAQVVNGKLAVDAGAKALEDKINALTKNK